MTTEVKRLIRVRVEKSARFKRDGFGKKRQLSDSWRKPRGQHSKQREQKKAKGALPKPGFGSPVAVRGMHPSGYFEVLVSSLKELEGLDPVTQAVRIAANVGTRKRMAIQDKAITAGLRVLNARVVKAAKKPAKATPVKKEEKEKKAEKKPAPSRAGAAPRKEPKKVTVKARAEPKPEPEAVTEPEAAPAEKQKKAEKAEKPKKAPARKTAAKPKAEKAEKTEKKAPAKKTAAKPKATKTAEAKPKAATKTRATTIKKGVKKNE